MSLYKFGPNDIFHNRIKTYPDVNFLIYSDKVYYKGMRGLSGTLNASDSLNHVPVGYLSLYEMNVDRPANQLIYPFITKQGSFSSFKTVTADAFNSDFSYGDEIVGTYPLSASISIDNYDGTLIGSGTKLAVLKNTMNFNTPLSRHFAYTSSIVDTWNKESQELRLISIPSIFYGSSIKKGSVDLGFYVSGSLVGRLQDTQKNGELIEVSPDSTTTGSVAGVVLYNEGFIILTGSWNLSPTHTEDYRLSGTPVAPSWRYFGTTSSLLTWSSFSVDFQGTNYIPTVTMFAHAKKGEINHSNNPTFITSGETMTAIANSTVYKESEKTTIKNIVSSSHAGHTASFSKHTYISKVGVYDKDRNLIAIAKLATPVKKTENRDFTFKLKLDF